MKTTLVSLFFVGSTLLAGAQVTEVGDAPAAEPWQTSKAARAAAAEVKATIGESWEKMKEAPYEQRAAVKKEMTAAEGALDASILEWTARKDALAVESRPAANTALEDVRNAREVLRQKVNSLDNVTVETWNSVMSELDSAWQRMRSSASALAVKLERV